MDRPMCERVTRDSFQDCPNGPAPGPHHFRRSWRRADCSNARALSLSRASSELRAAQAIAARKQLATRPTSPSVRSGCIGNEISRA